jgi:uncharacterized protein YjbI with pentapeptide repeats
VTYKDVLMVSPVNFAPAERFANAPLDSATTTSRATGSGACTSPALGGCLAPRAPFNIAWGDGAVGKVVSKGFQVLAGPALKTLEQHGAMLVVRNGGRVGATTVTSLVIEQVECKAAYFVANHVGDRTVIMAAMASLQVAGTGMTLGQLATSSGVSIASLAAAAMAAAEMKAREQKANDNSPFLDKVGNALNLLLNPIDAGGTAKDSRLDVAEMLALQDKWFKLLNSARPAPAQPRSQVLGPPSPKVPPAPAVTVQQVLNHFTAQMPKNQQKTYNDVLMDMMKDRHINVTSPRKVARWVTDLFNSKDLKRDYLNRVRVTLLKPAPQAARPQGEPKPRPNPSLRPATTPSAPPAFPGSVPDFSRLWEPTASQTFSTTDEEFTRRVLPQLTPQEGEDWREYAQNNPDIVTIIREAGHDASDADRAEAVRALLRGAAGQDVAAWLRAGGLGSSRVPPGGGNRTTAIAASPESQPPAKANGPPVDGMLVDPKTYLAWKRAGRDCSQLSVNLEYADLSHEDLSNLDLAGLNLKHANLADANLSGTNLSGANLQQAFFCRTNLSGANLQRANLYGANLKWARLKGANLTNANLFAANLEFANLSGANLTAANLSETTLSKADLSHVNLTGANLTNASLYWTDLTLANLTNVNATKARFVVATLTSAVVDGISVEEANLSASNLSGIDMNKISAWPLRVMGDANYAKLLETSAFGNPFRPPQSTPSSSPRFDIDAILENSDEPFGPNPNLSSRVSNSWANYFIRNSDAFKKEQQELTALFYPKPRPAVKAKDAELVSDATWTKLLALIQVAPPDAAAHLRRLLPEPMKHETWTQRQALAWANHHEDAAAWMGMGMIDGVSADDFGQLNQYEQQALAEQLYSAADHAASRWLWDPFAAHPPPAIDYGQPGGPPTRNDYVPVGAGKVFMPYMRRSLAAP